MHLLFIVNPKASTMAQWTLAEFERDCRAGLSADGKQATYEMLIPESPEDLRRALDVRLAEGGVDRVVVCGGDGTISETLPVMARYTQVPIAILPLGTGNLLATNLGIPFELPDALSVAIGVHLQPVDLAHMNEALFILNASVGIDAEIMARTDREFKKRWGLLAYFIRGIPLLSAAAQARFTIDADGCVIRTRAIGITVFNAGSAVPSGLQLAPDTRPDDGLLHGVIFKPNTGWDYLMGLLQVVFSIGLKRRRVIQHVVARRFRVTCQPAMMTQVDGNVIGETPVIIEVLPQRLHICVPPPETA